jgi:MoaA/NifB/PqqE/SkfB family radical SAM enzyme
MREYIRMSPTVLTGSDAPSASAGPGVAPLRPIPRPKTGLFKLMGEVLRDGGPGYLQFAITNICNAKCDFCGFAVDRFDPKQRRSVTLAEARDVIDICVRNHIGYLLFVGGEPLVHKDLRAMTRYAAERGIHPMICTNGSPPTNSR